MWVVGFGLQDDGQRPWAVSWDISRGFTIQERKEKKKKKKENGEDRAD